MLCRSILKGLTFDKSGVFVNTSRVHPSYLAVESRRLKIAGTNNNAVGIMLGVISECYLVGETTSGSSISPYLVRKVTIVPFAQEMRRDTSLWGQLFDFDVVAGTVSSLGFSFLSRKQGTSNFLRLLQPDLFITASSAPASPSKRGGLFMTVATPMVSVMHGD
jgi:hypothetical protein